MKKGNTKALIVEAYELLETRTLKETANVFAGDVERAVEKLQRKKLDIHDPGLRRIARVRSVLKRIDPTELGRTDRKLRAKILWVSRRLRQNAHNTPHRPS